MDFLADLWVSCPVCEGHRFNRETLQVRYKGRSIAKVLEMDIQEALAHFENLPAIAQKLQTLHDVGLDYMKLGQPSPTLSGGEAQRIKLARELVKKSTGRTLYLLDEPTTGLHFADIELLLRVLHGFVDAGNTVLVVEHNPEVVKTADWIIDLGPEGGERGGQIVAAGTPEQLARNDRSYTGQVLRRFLGSPLLPGEGQGEGSARPARFPAPSPSVPLPEGGKHRHRAELARAIKVRGAREHNLKGIDVDIPRDRITVCCGPSGSGKTSLAMDTVYAEGQRRYVESLSAYARQFVDKMQKPRLDHIEGLSPAIAIEQKHAGHTPRSTVGTVTEIYDYLRILVARLGQPYCPACEEPVGTQSADEIIEKLRHPAGTKLYLMAPLEVEVGERYETLWEEMRKAGYVRVRIDGQTYSLDQPPEIDRRRKHRVEVLIDRLMVRPTARIAAGRQRGKRLGPGRGRVERGLPAAGPARARLAQRNPQPALRLPAVRAEFRAARAAPLLLQQRAGLVPGLRGAGHADGHESGRPAAGPEAHAGPGRRGPLARRPRWPVRTHAGKPLGRHGHPGRCALRRTRRQAPPADLSWDGPTVVRGRGTGVSGRAGGRDASGPLSVVSCPLQRTTDDGPLTPNPESLPIRLLPLPVQGPLSRPGRGQPHLARAPCPAGAPGGRGRVYGLRRGPVAGRCRGRAVPRPHDGRVVPHEFGQAVGRVPRLAAHRRPTEGGRRGVPRDLQPHAVPGGRGFGVSALGGRPPRSPAARCSGSGWRPKWAADCAACSTCSTSPPSACTPTTTSGCWAPWRNSATWATRCWWSSTTAT